MENRIYPAIFHKEDNAIWVEFPDLPGCLTQGDTMEKAFKMAQEALALWLDGANNIPVATAIDKIKAEKDAVVMFVCEGSAEGIVQLKKTRAPYFIELGLEKKGYSKYQVALILDVDRSYITRISTGDRVPSVDMAKRIGALLDFDWRIFYEEVV